MTCAAQKYCLSPWWRYERHDGPVEAVLLRKNTVLPGRSWSVMVRLQAWTHTDELEQPNQLYLKEVGSLNAGAPVRLSMCAHVPPYPARVGPAIPPTTWRQALL